MTYFSNKRSNVLRYILAPPASALEIGCGNGEFLLLLEQKYGCDITGIEIDKHSSRIAANKVSRIINADVESLLEDGFSLDPFDLIILNDVIEHVKNPSSLLAALIGGCQNGTNFIFSIPNFIFIDNIASILWSRDFRYSESGILDKTHLRFFTKKSIHRLFEPFNLSSIAISPLNKASSLKWRVFNFFTLGLLRDFLVYQYIVVCTK